MSWQGHSQDLTAELKAGVWLIHPEDAQMFDSFGSTHPGEEAVLEGSGATLDAVVEPLGRKRSAS